MAALRRTSSWLFSFRNGTILSKPSVAEALPNAIQDIREKYVRSIDANREEIRYLKLVQADCGMLKNRPQWQPPLRDRIHKLLNDSPFEPIILSLVLVQLSLAVYITDLTAYQEDRPEEKEPAWFVFCNAGFLFVYIVELFLRIYVYRGNFFECGWHTLDLVVVVIDGLGMLFTVFVSTTRFDMSVCRLFRVLRVARAGRILRYFPEVFIMAKSLAGTFRIVLWSFIILGLLLVAWSLVSVVYIHPLNVKLANEECKNVYATMFDSVLTLIQTVVAADSFGLCSMPLMRAHPWTVLYFLGVLGSVGLGLLNLVLSAIVDRASEVRQQNNELLNVARLHFFEEARDLILKRCSSDDVNNTGLVSLENIMDAYDHTESFQDSCDTLDATRAELNVVFRMMDEDQCGSVDYKSFANHLFRLKTDNQHSTVVLIRQQLVEMSHKILKEIDTMKSDMKKIEQYKTKDQRPATKEIGGGDWATSEKRSLQLAQARDELILEQSSERKRKMLETICYATKLMKDNGIYLEGLSELLVDLQDKNAIVLLACDQVRSAPRFSI